MSAAIRFLLQKLKSKHRGGLVRQHESQISVFRNKMEVSLYPGRRWDEAGAPSRKLLSEKHRLTTLEVPEHEHKNFCLHLQTGGTPELEWWWKGKNKVERPAPGALILLPPGTRDRLRWEGSSERFVLSLDTNFIQEVADEFQHDLQPVFRTHWNLRDEGLRLLLSEIGGESAEGWPLGTLYADLLGLSLTTVLLKQHAEQTIRSPLLRGGLSAHVLKSSLWFMTDNLHRELPLSEIATAAGLSQFHFARLFRSSTGQTPHQYLLEQRLRRAKHLLRSTHLEVSQIGCDVGFASHTHFARIFKNKEGITPTAWRKAQ